MIHWIKTNIFQHQPVQECYPSQFPRETHEQLDLRQNNVFQPPKIKVDRYEGKYSNVSSDRTATIQIASGVDPEVFFKGGVGRVDSKPLGGPDIFPP